MKRVNLIFKQGASVLHLPKPTIVLAALMVLSFSMAPDIDAQRRGGSGRSMGQSSGSHVRQSVGRIGASRSYYGNYGHVGRFSGGHYSRWYWGIPGWGYAFLPFWGDYYWGIPPYSVRFYIDGYNYYDSDGIYYKQENNKYRVVPAPIGHKVKVLPKGSLEFSLDGIKYYYYFGTYYTPQDGKYEVVQPPIGAEVDSIPDGYEKVIIDGQTYFTLNGVQYKAVVHDNVIWYRVVKNNGVNAAPANQPANGEPM